MTPHVMEVYQPFMARRAAGGDGYESQIRAEGLRVPTRSSRAHDAAPHHNPAKI